ncbi:MAG: hypothetical protein Q9201_005452 [Fulgogasparrea decipioides]
MCWPRLEGGLEIEERYPRTNDPREPRRKRLHFVRDRSSPGSSSDDYTLIHSSFNQARPVRREMLQQTEHRAHQLQGLNQQQDLQMRQLHGHNQQLQQQLTWQQEDMRRQLQLIQAQHQHHQPPPPPPPIGPHQPAGIEPVPEVWHSRPRIVEVAPHPRSRMPSQLQKAAQKPDDVWLES